jgi:hypothetical protein
LTISAGAGYRRSLKGGELMNRFGHLTALVLFVSLLGACEDKGGALRVDRVEPPQGITAGGDQVTILGGGFQPGKTQVEVRFGRRKAESVVIAAADQISVVTPAGDKGPVDVTLSFDSGKSFKIPGGFKYVDPQGNDNVRKAFLSKKAGDTK